MAVGFTKPRRIELGDDLSGFHCGKELLDSWLLNHALNALNRGTAVTYATMDENGSLAGFYSLSANSVSRGDVHGGWLARNTPNRFPSSCWVCSPSTIVTKAKDSVLFS